MFVVRPSRMNDLDGLQALAQKTGIGFTSLPDDRPTLKKKLQASIEAFESDGDTATSNSYLLMMEDTKTGKIVGTAAIIVGVGLERPFYNYRLLRQTQVCYDPPTRVDTELLHLANDFSLDTEVATLFLDPDYRRDNLGKLLAKARYMFIASHPERFTDRVFAEMRGWVDENNNSPFWEAIGRHFFGMDFKTADEINGMGNSQFIADLMPKFPIYTALLPEAAQEVIGRPQDAARPAYRLLEKEGFRYTGAVDIFDAGPVLEVDKSLIWTARNSIEATLGGTVDGVTENPAYLIANPDLKNFRVTMAHVVDGSRGVWLCSDAAQALDLKEGDALLYAPIEKARIAE
ncbi:arginine N-succinyltransferase [Kordiimonas pumila]|uniref:Arginine N-succinyltransferase n=1 Tax=Kordiimonas pumila TaxID=2161677 RepID=A0ABV7D500_9PROT|nr:arginine N-succinyltransferase [Kordiimonas pumila]